MTFQDRMDQINWIEEQADIISWYGEGTVKELVAYWEQHTETPDWFDKHDRILLVELVTKAVE